MRDGRYRCLAFQADQSRGPGYPADQVELFSEVHLRTALSLSAGDSVVISMRDL